MEKEETESSFFAKTSSLVVRQVTKLMDRAARANRGRSTGGNTNRKERQQSSPPGEEEFSSLLNNAEYEIRQDCYRGLQSQQQSLEIGTTITTPWNACSWGTLQPEPITTKEVDSTVVVRHLGHCACPSLKAWTKNLQESNNKKKRGKKRGRQAEKLPSSDQIFAVGTRPNEPNFRCPCDYNPLCLGTLGGVVNDILTERSKETQVIESSSSESPDLKRPAKRPQHEQIETKKGASVLESLPGPNTDKHGKRDKNEVINLLEKDDEDKDQNDNIFEFLDERDPLVQLKPLLAEKSEKKRALLPPGDPAEVFSSELHQSVAIDIKYSPATADLLKTLRRSIISDATNIRCYARKIVGLVDGTGALNAWTPKKYMNALTEWQKSLRFENPIANDDEVQEAHDDPFAISVPPGIKNLGATCYLNTQLQCLAQNPAFLKGIFSWRQVNNSHNMNAVMSKLQLLLAQMVLGGDCKLSTLDFSNALGLEHNEQQDPNEFARLLFERMDESFQECDNDGDLSNLLQRIFHGVSTYETICLTCEHSSERSEGFMDLNLPIEQREKQDEKKIKKDISDYFGSKSVDTDVQYCLDQYTQAELLNGDNQYFCSACDCKRDAKRVLKLTELPPVLNVQLSRYVFDRTQFVKKKLSDKVLLPTTLQVPKSDGTKKTYILCAVMRHQGTSAYRGHYVAEAMDWLSGQWFEFNDETVKLLSEGPSCSYDPSRFEASDKKMSSLAGSQDAYNMYYVEENFLAENAVHELSQRGRLCSVECKSGEDVNNVLAEIMNQRKTKYAALMEMCFADGKTADRVGRRKFGIRSFMFQDAESLVLDPVGRANSGHSFVWVEADFLRRFLRLEHDIDEQIRSPGPILRHKHLLCEHARLPPEVARKGKLLPRSSYDAYVSLLKGEKELIRKESHLIVNEGEVVNDCEIPLSTNVICEACSKSYCSALEKKLVQLRNVKDLHDLLDCQVDQKALYFYEDETPTCAEDEFAYALSKKTATAFKNSVRAVIKTFSKLEEGALVDKTSPGGEITIFEGIDSIDISPFSGDFIVTTDTKKPKEKKGSEARETLDKYFNSVITCKHNKCNCMNQLKRIRFVSWKGWQKVKKVFPEAIELKKRRTMNGATSTDEDGCRECQIEKLSLERLQTDLERWAKETRENYELKSLVDGRRTVSREMVVHNFTLAQSGCRLVHRTDIDSWLSTLKALKPGKRNNISDSKSLRAFVENIAFPNYHTVVLEFERQPIDRAITSLRSLICREHKLVIESAIFRANGDSASDNSKQSHLLSDCIAVLADEEYREYIASLSELLNIVNPVGEDTEIGSIASPVLIDTERTLLNDIRRITESYHPRINKIGSEERPEDILLLSCDGSTKKFLLSPGVCRCETCRKEFAPLLLPPNNDDDKIESISIDSNDSKSQRNKKLPAAGLMSADPILVESDIEDDFTKGPSTFPLRVFQVKEDASLQEALESLEEGSALPRETDLAESLFLRRSSRARKTRYPVGCLQSENSVNVGMHHNMAAMRLLLYEKCEVGLSGWRLTLVLPSEGQIPKTLEIKFEWGQRSLQELFDELNDRSDSNMTISSSTDLLLLYQRDNNNQSGPLHETVMDSLLQIANLAAASSEKQEKNKKRKISSERGFQGTLLHSSRPCSNDNQSSGPAETMTQTEIDVSAVSDEERDTKMPAGKDRSPKKSSTFVLSESESGEDDLLTKSPFSPKRKKQAILRGMDNPEDTIHSQMIVDQSESSDEEKHNLPQQANQGNASNNLKMDHSAAIKIEFDEEEEKLQGDISQSLAQLIGDEVDQSKCWDATGWALKHNSMHTNRAALLDSAYAKYLDSVL